MSRDWWGREGADLIGRERGSVVGVNEEVTAVGEGKGLVFKFFFFKHVLFFNLY